jgi:alpha-L-fucosidase
MGNGKPRALERAMMTTLGEWVDIYSEALFLPTPTDVVVDGREKEFLLRGDGCYYFFAFDLFMETDAELTKKRRFEDYTYHFKLAEKIKEVKWLDNGESVPYTQDGNEVTLVTAPQKYGEQLVVRVAKLEI